MNIQSASSQEWKITDLNRESPSEDRENHDNRLSDGCFSDPLGKQQLDQSTRNYIKHIQKPKIHVLLNILVVCCCIGFVLVWRERMNLQNVNILGRWGLLLEVKYGNSKRYAAFSYVFSNVYYVLYPWTPELKWTMKVLHPQYMGHNPRHIQVDFRFSLQEGTGLGMWKNVAFMVSLTCLACELYQTQGIFLFKFLRIS